MSQYRGKIITAETIQPMLSRADIQLMLNIGGSSAIALMKSMPHFNISMPGSKYQYLRVRRADFDKWLKEREVAGV